MRLEDSYGRCGSDKIRQTVPDAGSGDRKSSVTNGVFKDPGCPLVTEWWHGVVVNTMFWVNVVALHWARLLLGWVTVC